MIFIVFIKLSVYTQKAAILSVLVQLGMLNKLCNSFHGIGLPKLSPYTGLRHRRLY